MSTENKQANVDPLRAKIIIRGQIVAKTALHIGGAKDGLDIGGVDLNVIKNYKGEPFIPGSSLKGKLRSMLARVEGTVKVSPSRDNDKSHTDKHVNYLARIFGLPAEENNEDDNAGGNGHSKLTRLLVRDAPLLLTDDSPRQELYDGMDFPYTDVKFENSIDRVQGKAQHPRQLERVPANSRFSFELVLNEFASDAEVYQANLGTDARQERLSTAEPMPAIEFYLNAIGMAMRLLKDDYLGGHGSRGYGQIGFEGTSVQRKVIDNFSYVAEEKPSDFIVEFATALQQLEESKAQQA